MTLAVIKRQSHSTCEAESGISRLNRNRIDLLTEVTVNVEVPNSFETLKQDSSELERYGEVIFQSEKNEADRYQSNPRLQEGRFDRTSGADTAHTINTQCWYLNQFCFSTSYWYQ